MTAGAEAGALLDAGDLAAQIRNAVRRTRVGGRGEQADDTELADQVSRGVELLDADIVEIDAPMHARADIGLGDDERPRLLQKRHDFRGKLEQFGAAPQYAQFARTHDAETAFKHRLK